MNFRVGDIVLFKLKASKDDFEEVLVVEKEQSFYVSLKMIPFLQGIVNDEMTHEVVALNYGRRVVFVPKEWVVVHEKMGNVYDKRISKLFSTTCPSLVFKRMEMDATQKHILMVTKDDREMASFYEQFVKNLASKTTIKPTQFIAYCETQFKKHKAGRFVTTILGSSVSNRYREEDIRRFAWVCVL